MMSSFTYIIDGKVLFIEDTNGRMSVTNDIENVLEKVSEDLKTSVSNFDIIYRDSEGCIDGVKTKDGKFADFYRIGEENYYKAKLKIK
jgi:hypothetical protein